MGACSRDGGAFQHLSHPPACSLPSHRKLDLGDTGCGNRFKGKHPLEVQEVPLGPAVALGPATSPKTLPGTVVALCLP